MVRPAMKAGKGGSFSIQAPKEPVLLRPALEEGPWRDSLWKRGLRFPELVPGETSCGRVVTDVRFLCIICEYILSPLVIKEAVLAYDKVN